MEIPPNTPHSIAFDADLRSAVQKHPGSKQAVGVPILHFQIENG